MGTSNKAKEWSTEDIDFLKEWYPTEGAILCAEVLDRSVSSVYHKASRINVNSNTSMKWTTEQYKEYLKSTEYEVLEPYINTMTLILHKHIICGHIWRTNPDSIKQGYGCPECGGSRKVTNEEYIEYLKDTEYEALEPYLNNKTKIKHKHKICGHVWKIKPNKIKNGRGCPNCIEYGFQPNKPAVVYFLYFPILDIYKIGVSSNYRKRQKDFQVYSIVLKVKKFITGLEAQKLEKYLLNKYKQFKYNTGSLTSGNTETFSFEKLEIKEIMEILK